MLSRDRLEWFRSDGRKGLLGYYVSIPSQIKYYLDAHKNDGPVEVWLESPTGKEKVRLLEAWIENADPPRLLLEHPCGAKQLMWWLPNKNEFLGPPGEHLVFPFLSREAIAKRAKRAQRKKRRKQLLKARKVLQARLSHSYGVACTTALPGQEVDIMLRGEEVCNLWECKINMQRK